MNNPVLEISNVFFKYSKQSEFVVKDFNLNVYESDFISIIGPNGAGKSTLLKIIMGILKQQNGIVLFNNDSIENYSKKELAKKIAYLPQEINEWHDINVFEMVLQGRYPYLKGMGFANKNDIEICLHNMKLCGVYDFKERTMFHLSGGEKQRVRLASILSQEPDLLILDEPTSFLDIHNERDFFSILQGLTGSKTSILMATHNVNFASLYCNNMVLMNKGKILTTGSAEKVVTQKNIDAVYGEGFGVNIHPDSERPFLYPFKPKGDR